MFNSGFNNFYPYYTRPTGFFAGLKAKFDWGAILNNTQKTLNIVNQAIPQQSKAQYQWNPRSRRHEIVENSNR